jgi:hypothetical protein
MEEVDFYEEICLTSLHANKTVRFTAVVNSNGKLIVGKFKRSNTRRQLGVLPHTSGLLDGSEHQRLFLRQSCRSFYHAQLTPTLQDVASRSYYEECSDKAHFEITEIDNKIGAKLAVTPLTDRRDRYLCVYLQLPPEISTDQHQQIMSKISNSIQ